MHVSSHAGTERVFAIPRTWVEYNSIVVRVPRVQITLVSNLRYPNCGSLGWGGWAKHWPSVDDAEGTGRSGRGAAERLLCQMLAIGGATQKLTAT